MASHERLNPAEQESGAKAVLGYINRFSTDSSIYETLARKGEPVDIISESSDESVVYVQGEKLQEFNTLVSLLRLSPQHQLLSVAKKRIIRSEERNLLNDVLSKPVSQFTENEKVLFDSTYPENQSMLPLLYKPVNITPNVRANIRYLSREAQKESEKDKKRGLIDMYMREHIEGVQEVAVNLVSKIFNLTPPGKLENQFMDDAYINLGNSLKGRDTLSDYDLYQPRRDEMIRFDFTDPSFILIWELESRGYDVKLFRAVAPSGAFRKPKDNDGLDNCAVALIGDDAREVVDKLNGPMGAMNNIYRGPKGGISYSDTLYSLRMWQREGFTEDERLRMIAFGRLKEIDDDQHNFRVSRIKPLEEPGVHWQRHWDDVKKEVEAMGVGPADQQYIWGVVNRFVDKVTNQG